MPRVGRQEEKEREREREKNRQKERERDRERESKRRRLFASAKRTWPATAAEVVKRLVLTTSANCLGPLTRRRRGLKGCVGGWEWGCGVGW